MKILQDGKEVKDAQVIYTSYGTVDTVRIKGIHFDASAFELVEEKAEVKTKENNTKPTSKTVKKS